MTITCRNTCFFGVLLLFCGTLLLSVVPPSEAISFPWWGKGEPPSFEEAWDTTMKKLDGALGLLDKHDSLPDKKFVGRDKTKNDEKIEEILGDLLLLLSDSRTTRLRQEAQKLREYRAKKEQEIAAYEEKMLTAPQKGSLLTKSREDWREKIVELRQEVVETDKALEECLQAIVTSLREEGISVSVEDVKGILVSVTGDDILGMYGVYKHVRPFPMPWEIFSPRSPEVPAWPSGTTGSTPCLSEPASL